MRIFLALLCASLVSSAQAQDAGALRARHVALKEQLAHSPFGRALHVESSSAAGVQKGQIFAVVEQPFSVVAPALARSADWCDILRLQVNVKGCDATDEALTAFITRKARDRVDSARRVDFRFERAARSADYLRVGLSAESGPVGTRDYHVRLEAAPLDSRRTFLHMSYTYALGAMARFAMEAYLAGAGRDKRGFTVEGGERGVVERGAMRHYLAIEAHLESLGQPMETRLRRWYGAIASYPQLREELSLEQYVEMKRREASG